MLQSIFTVGVRFVNDIEGVEAKKSQLLRKKDCFRHGGWQLHALSVPDKSLMLFLRVLGERTLARL